MFVCLCVGVTSHDVDKAVANGACTSKQVTEACGAGGDCGRCRRTLRAIIATHHDGDGCPSENTCARKSATPDRLPVRPGRADR
nr:(2Fe-2S)-binding protein [Mycolicibacterium tusciae]